MEISLRYTWFGERLTPTQFWWAVAGACVFVMFVIVCTIVAIVKVRKKK